MALLQRKVRDAETRIDTLLRDYAKLFTLQLRGEGSAQKHRNLAPPPSRLKGLVVPLSTHEQGCRLLQTAFAIYTTEETKVLAQEFKGWVRECVESPHANHVLQRLVELMPPASLSFLLPELKRHWEFAALAKHKYGCRILERMFEHYTGCGRIGAELTDFVRGGLHEQSVLKELCFHTFGNFVVQHILEHGSKDQRDCVVEALRSDLENAALDEHCVCVLDKALTALPLAEQVLLALELLSLDLAGGTHLLEAMLASRTGQVAAERLLYVVAAGRRPLWPLLESKCKQHYGTFKASKGGRQWLDVLDRLRAHGASRGGA